MWTLQVACPDRPGLVAALSGCLYTHGANIVDVAPTVLQLMQLPVPDRMDGRVLAEIFSDRPAEPLRESVPAASNAYADDDAYSAEDEEAVKERLRQLGYL